MTETVLVVDDEERVRTSLRGILNDEGFRVLDTGNAPAALDIIARERPRLVLLDVWMPEIDGIELLRRIKLSQPAVEVIMISGHANIQSAVAATKLGAADFIEKPFSVDGLLASIARVLARDESGGASASEARALADNLRTPEARASAGARPQRTIARSIVAGGQGLHTGLKTGVILHPAPPGFGIVFSPLSDEVAIAAQLDNVSDTDYNTTLTSGGHSVRTVEHLMSALHGFGITNLLVKTHGEVPALDGSASEFCRLIEEIGIQEQAPMIEPIRVTRPLEVRHKGRGEEHIRIEPADQLIVDYELVYPAPIGTQRVHFELTSSRAYTEEIAPARTFGFVREMQKLSEMGLASGGRLDNCILVDDEKVVNTELRFPDEFARHKVLDLIGDLYLLGRPIIGHLIASRTGHSDNHALLEEIRKSL
ncbi:MAG TPA: UDP-3-O-acyl-N-acetylglucosamine deacetylase [Candidatus Binataceae bacterium]|nr:UDP-3-O-acyl-N-acetylglucosamine deacetylase [Candidatus Binataceae bacterium]